MNSDEYQFFWQYVSEQTQLKPGVERLLVGLIRHKLCYGFISNSGKGNSWPDMAGLSLGGEVPARGSAELCTSKLEGIWVVPTLQWLCTRLTARETHADQSPFTASTDSHEAISTRVEIWAKEGKKECSHYRKQMRLCGGLWQELTGTDAILFLQRLDQVAHSMQTLLHSVSTKASMVLGCINV